MIALATRLTRPVRRRPRLVALLAALAACLLLSTPAFAQPPGIADGDYRPIFGISPRLVVWVVAQLELLFAAFLLGVPLFALIAEIVGYRTGDEKYDRLAKEFTSLLTLSSAIAALLGGLLTFALFWSYPQVMGYLTGIFGPTMVVFGFLFFAEVLTLYLYYYGWDHMKGARKRWHIGLGVLLNIWGTLLMAVPNSWATFMMSPAGQGDMERLFDPETGAFLGTVMEAVNNPLWMPLNIHRFIGNIMFGGFVVGAYAAVRFLAAKAKEERAYYDWMGYVGNFVGVAALIPLPFAGYYLGREIYSYSTVMGNNMMGGQFSWPFVIQGIMVGLLFILANFYLWNGMGRFKGAERYTGYIKYINAILIVCFAIWLTPHNLPLSGREQALLGGQYHPLLKFFGLMAAKNAAINFILISTFVSFLLYRRANKKAPVSVRDQGTGAKVTVMVGGGLTLLILGAIAYWLMGKDPITMMELDPDTISAAAVAEWQRLIDLVLYLVVGVMATAAGAVGLTLTDRGQLGQVLYVAVGVLASVFVLGPYGFVVMQDLSPFLREIAVTQWAIVMTVLLLVTAIDIVLYNDAEAMGGIAWGEMPERSQYALIALAVTAVVTMGWMGVIRSGLREDWHVFGVVRDTSQWSGTPAIDEMMYVVAGIVIVFFIMIGVVFALTSLAKRRTAPVEPVPPPSAGELTDAGSTAHQP